MAEIESAALKSGEDTALHQERDRLLNHKLIADTLTNAYTMLDNEDFSSLTNVRSAMNDLESIEDYDPAYKELSGSLSETYYVLEDVSKRLEDILDGLDFDGDRLLQVESRLDLINSITRKYGGQVDDVLDYFAQISKEYSLLTGSNLSSEDMDRELKALERELVELAQELSQARHGLAAQLEAEIKQELQDLYMEKARFKVQFSKGKFNREGNEQVEFYISANPGEDFKPLVKVASGGELSRLMLAIKSAFLVRKARPVLSLTKWIRAFLVEWPRLLLRRFTRLAPMAKYWPFPICRRSLRLPIISSLLRRFRMRIRPSQRFAC